MARRGGGRNPFEEANKAPRGGARGRGRGGAARFVEDDDDDDEEVQVRPPRGGRGRGAFAGGRGRGRGGFAFAVADDDDDDEEDMAAAMRGRGRGRGGPARGRGRGGAHFNFAVPDDDDEDDDDEDDEDDEESDEEVPEISKGELQRNVSVLNQFKSHPRDVDANALANTVTWLNPKMRAPRALEHFTKKENFEPFVHLVRAIASEDMLPNIKADVPLKLVVALAAFARRRQTSDVIVQSNILREMMKVIVKFANQTDLMVAGLEMIDSTLQTNLQRLQLGKLFDEEVEESEENKAAIRELLSFDARDEIVAAGFLEFCIPKLPIFDQNQRNLTYNILFSLFEDIQTKENYPAKSRFLAAGGLIELEGRLREILDAGAENDDEKIDEMSALLIVRVFSVLCVDDKAMAAAFGDTGVLELVDRIVQKYRDANFDTDQPLEDVEEQLLTATIEFVSVICEDINNHPKVFATKLIDGVVNFLEHAALEDTNLDVHPDMRAVLLNVLVSCFEAEQSSKTAPHMLTQYMIDNDNAITMLFDLFDQTSEPVEDEDEDEELMDDEDDIHQRREEELAAVLDLLRCVASDKPGAELLFRKNLHGKVLDKFEESKAALEGHDDEDEPIDEDLLTTRMEKYLSVWVNMAVLPAVQQFLIDRRLEPALRQFLTDDNTADFLRVETMDLLSNLIDGAAWLAIVSNPINGYLDRISALLSHHSGSVRASAINCLSSVSRHLACANYYSGKVEAIAKIIELSRGVDTHNPKPESDDEEEDEEDEEEEDDEEDEDEDDEEDEVDLEFLKHCATNVLLNLSRYPSSAAVVAADPSFVEAARGSLTGPSDATLRILTSLTVAQLATHLGGDVSGLLLLVEQSIPASLPDGEVKDEEKSPQLTLDPAVEWDVANDILPLVTSQNPIARRLASFLLAQVASNPNLARFSKDLDRVSLQVAADGDDALTKQFASLAISKLP